MHIRNNKISIFIFIFIQFLSLSPLIVNNQPVEINREPKRENILNESNF